MCRILKTQFGAEASRVKCVAGSQAANPEVSRTILACDLAIRDGPLQLAQRREDELAPGALAHDPSFGRLLGALGPEHLELLAAVPSVSSLSAPPASADVAAPPGVGAQAANCPNGLTTTNPIAVTSDANWASIPGITRHFQAR